jgi:hypothetical protein
MVQAIANVVVVVGAAVVAVDWVVAVDCVVCVVPAGLAVVDVDLIVVEVVGAAVVVGAFSSLSQILF